MIQILSFRKPNAGKRKRIPLDPSLWHTVKSTPARPGDQAQHTDDRDPDMIHHFRINARLEDQKMNHDSPNMGMA